MAIERPASNSPHEPRWGGAALLRPGVLAFAGSIGTTETHAHHAIQIIATTSPLTVIDEHGAQHRGVKLVVPADARHRIVHGAAKGAIVFLDPESDAGRSSDLYVVRAGWAATPALRPDTDGWSLATVVEQLIAPLSPHPTAYEVPGRHRAVAEALSMLPGLAASGPVSGTQLAARLGVSTSRLTHLFTEQVGIPLRRYVLWLRLRIAITRVQAGDDLTDAAHGAGFADSAHLARTTREMFGLAPSALSRHVSWDLGSTD